MSDPMLKLKIFARLEMTLLRLQARRHAIRIAGVGLSLVFVLFALGMLNFAGYQVLVETQSPAWAALVVALIDGGLALVIVLISRLAGPGVEQEQMVQELRDFAQKEVTADFEKTRDEVVQVTKDLKRIRNGFSVFTSKSGNLAQNLAALLDLLIGVIKKGRSK